MEVIKTAIPEVVILEPKVYQDDRGYFFEAFSEEVFSHLVTPTHFVQDNESRSSYGVVRGLHFQAPPHAQAKLVRVVKGSVLDVAVDLRKGSPSYGTHVAVELSEENHRMLFIPRGFAHGFSVLSPDAIFQYKCDNYYAPQSEGAVAWNDPTLSIDWRVPTSDVILSTKDAHHPCLDEFNTPFIYGEE
ncbi:dTDP-4-dehydrorhamnose 3,5-epimerase [Porphyromonas catoniae]|jgi:dTDP-4-dehydrorhamnose 3,5-epimerase|uniref:dTDP-4-dehydrorhamnose 3,5-epimerase n=1 Tax=Porphyromonas catoniae TaxID=41976 RepID=UPI0028D40A8D|nr:dTDP-4-dehydrorhamnose 3,5-epimerase [Porphyromonas catoniae]